MLLGSPATGATKRRLPFCLYTLQKNNSAVQHFYGSVLVTEPRRDNLRDRGGGVKLLGSTVRTLVGGDSGANTR